MRRIIPAAFSVAALGAALWLVLASDRTAPAGGEGPRDLAALSPGAAPGGLPAEARPGAPEGSAARFPHSSVGDPVHRSGASAEGGGDAAASGDPDRDAERDARGVRDARGREGAEALAGTGGDAALRSIRDADASEAGPEADTESPVDVDLEARAAELAESLHLLDEAEIDRRVDKALRSAPAGEDPAARDDTRRSVLADAAIIEDLARDHAGPNASPQELRRARDMGRTLLSSAGPEYRAQRLVGLGDRLLP